MTTDQIGQQADDQPRPQPRARAVFSTEDFALMKQAVGDYITKVDDEPRLSKLAALYHRLGRIG